MNSIATHAPATRFSDLVALTKPRILIFALMTAAGAMAVAPGLAGPSVWVPLLLGCGLIVAAANTLNMYLEREIDCKMSRTRTRPLPAGRMNPEVALIFGVSLAFIAMPILSFGVNPLTGLLGAIAFISYVMMYTPLKQRTTIATLIGSVPGAMPTLMGWTAATGSIDAGGLGIFALLFLWQIPHFHAIALFRRKEYQRAGLKILPVESGENTTRFAILFYLAIQVQVSLLLYFLGVAGIGYLAVASLMGGWYFLYALRGVLHGDARWAKNLFLISIVYLPVVYVAMVVNGVH